MLSNELSNEQLSFICYRVAASHAATPWRFSCHALVATRRFGYR